jgi:hypothetical protein
LIGVRLAQISSRAATLLRWKIGQLPDRFHLRRAAHLGDSFQELFPLHLARL